MYPTSMITFDILTDNKNSENSRQKKTLTQDDLMPLLITLLYTRMLIGLNNPKERWN